MALNNAQILSLSWFQIQSRREHLPFTGTLVTFWLSFYNSLTNRSAKFKFKIKHIQILENISNYHLFSFKKFKCIIYYSLFIVYPCYVPLPHLLPVPLIGGEEGGIMGLAGDFGQIEYYLISAFLCLSAVYSVMNLELLSVPSSRIC